MAQIEARFDRDRVMTWWREGMSLSEIGRRLGVSADVLRESLGDLDPGPEPDDNGPNIAPVR
jgi:hypothetical protein